MKIQLNEKVVITIICLLFLIPLVPAGLYQTHDASVNIARFAAYFKSFSDGQIPPRWAGNLNYNYGSPVFIFFYPLPGYAASALHFLGISFENSFKLLVSLAFILCAISFYIWSSKLFKPKVALTSSLIYALAPYHFLNIYVRGDIAELMALSIVPLVFYNIEKILDKPLIKNIVFGGIFYSLLILAHNSVSLLFTPVLFLYPFIRKRDKKSLYALLPILIGLAIASYFWIPALLESKYTNAALFVGNLFENNFISVSKILYANWGFGSDINKTGGLAPQLGIFSALIIILAVVKYIKSKKLDFLPTFWFAVLLISIFMATSYSFIIWSHISLLKLLEFPWRFFAVTSFAFAIFSAYILDFFEDKVLLVVLAIFIISCFQFVRVSLPYTSKVDSFYLAYPGTTYYHGEASPIWTAGDFSKFPKQGIEVISGEAKISNLFRKSNVHSFTVDSKANSTILDNTAYFPGWRVVVDGVKTPIQFQDINHRGLITFNVPKGLHKIMIVFGESQVRFISDIISFAGILFVIMLLIFGKRIGIIKKLYEKK